MPLNVSGGALEFDAIINGSQFQAQINLIQQQLQGLTRSAQREADAVEGIIKKTTTAIAAYASVATATNFIGDIVRVRGEFQQLEVAFRTMLKSKGEADKLLADAVKLAAVTPFTLQDVGSAAKQLLAYGFAAHQVINTIKMLGDVAAGVGAPLNDIVYLYGTLQTQGRAYTRDILQFTSRGIPIIGELAKQFGVTKDQVAALVEAGKVGFKDVEKAFVNMTSQGGLFFDLMKEQSKTLTGQISNLKDAWQVMLNEIGKSNEGTFHDALQAVTDLVKNYKTVLDILKVLVITYGSYRAAIIATTAVQAIQTDLTKGYTIAETLRYRAMLLSDKAMKLLNATMLSNPAVLIATGMAALVASLIIFNKESGEAAKKQKILSEVQAEAAKAITEEKLKLEALIKVAQDDTKSKEQRTAAIKQLNNLAPEYLGNLTLENIKTGEATAAINTYIQALERKARAQAVTNKLTDLQAKDIELQGVIDHFKDMQSDLGALNKSHLAGVIKEVQQTKDANLQLINDLKKSYQEELNAQLQGEGQKQEAKKRTLDVIDQEIKDLKAMQAAQSTTSQQFQDFQKKINALEAERKTIAGASKSEIKAQQTLETKTNELLSQRKGILEDIAGLQREAKQSGLLKEQSELDKVNEKYDNMILKITDFNQKIQQFNKANKANVQQIGQVDINALNDARKTELKNTSLKQDAEKFKTSLEAQKNLFAQYEEAKKTIGLQKATEMFASQTKGFQSYLQLLKTEFAKVAPKLVLGIANVADMEKLKTLSKEITDSERANEEDLLKTRIDNIVRLFSETATFNQKKKVLDTQYEKDLSSLRKDFQGKELEQQQKNLKKKYDQEYQLLQNNLIRESDLYQQLNQDIIGFSRERIKQEIEELKKQLKSGVFKDANGQIQPLTPQMKKDIQDAIDNLQGFYNSTAKVFGISVKQLQKIAAAASEISNQFHDLGGALEGVNDNLADTLNTVGDIASVASSAVSSIAGFASGNIIAGIAGLVKTVVGVFQIIKKARESEKKAQEEIAAFQLRLLQGEIQITQEYRERQREQIRLNKLKLDGLNAEKKLLEEQKKAVQDQYNNILSQLQQQTAVVDEVTKKYGGFLGIGRKTKVVEITQSLAGQTFEQLQALFDKGELTGKAKDLFEQLQKIQQEGVDIDKALQDLNAEAAQIFTGTTSDSILDSIVDGFKNGLHTAADFADSFEDLMRGALINALKFKYLEGPLKDFFDQFAAASESDNTLTQTEIDQLHNLFNSIISNADQQFQQLQQIAGLNFASSSSGANSLQGAIKGMSEQTAELIAGQFGGQRIATLEHLNVAKQALNAHLAIQNNTALTVARLENLLNRFTDYETGTRKLHIA